MKNFAESKYLERFLEILPGSLSWLTILFPFVFAFIIPELVAYFILIFNLYWFLKAFNMGRHLLKGHFHLKRNMKVDWDRKLRLTSDIKKLKSYLEKEYKRKKDRYLKNEITEVENLKGRQDLVKNYKEIVHAVIIATYKESPEILAETIEGLRKCNYDHQKLLVVLAGEGRDENFPKVASDFQKKYDGVFYDFLCYTHKDKVGEVKGKGSNITSAGRKMLKYLKGKKIDYDNVLVTTLDADHIVHPSYFSKLTYDFVIDPDRDRKTYQPVALLFNNIWDSPAPNRVAAIATSFWQLSESMKPFKLRTFASHTQSLKTLLVTDFWSVKTIVEDGHQYWRTYFAFNGNIEMVPLLVPVYQDCVLDETFFKTFKSQYLQRRRWSWGVSDFPYIVKNFLKHPHIPFFEKVLQISRQFVSHYSQGTASLLIATGWVPFLFNEQFRDSVLAHNYTSYSSLLLTVAWAAIFFNVLSYFSLLPSKPKNYSRLRYITMFTQWIFVPPVAILLASVPSMDSQTRLMFGKYLDFFVTPKVRRSEVTIDTN